MNSEDLIKTISKYNTYRNSINCNMLNYHSNQFKFNSPFLFIQVIEGSTYNTPVYLNKPKEYII